jgi:nucleoside-diphosphate-sugar epimerase
MRLLIQLAVAISLSSGAVSALVSFVTGANGYLGRVIVHEIVSSCSSSRSVDNSCHDDCVVCLVRPSRVSSEQAYWDHLVDQIKETNGNVVRVCVRPYDMLDSGKAFEAALQEQLQTTNDPQNICLYHVASVFGPTENHVQTALDNVKGTTDLIECLAKAVEGRADTCQFILTSSMAAVRGTGQIPKNDLYYTTDDWNTISQLDENNSWGTSYQWSKTESERRAWECCRRYEIPMISICPSFVFGPPAMSILNKSKAAEMSGSESFSMQLVRQWLVGKSPVQSRLFVDVRDVAQAHVAAAQRMSQVKNKRWIVSQETRIPSEVIAEWLRSVCRATRVSDPDKIHFDADFQGGAIPIGQKEVDAALVLEEHLGVSLRPVKETIMEMAQLLLGDKQHST